MNPRILCRCSPGLGSAVLLTLAFLASATAQTPPAPAVTPAPAPAVTPAPAPAVTPAPAPEPAVTPAPPEKTKPNIRKHTFGLGPAIVFRPPQKDDPEDSYELAPALSLQTRSAFVLGGVVGFEWTNDIVFHDWTAMKAGYDWYFAPTETEDEKDLKALKIGALWPGLILIPFGAANYTTGFGLVVWTSQNVPALYFDGGFQMALYLRLSDPQFRADFGLGGYGGVGFDFIKNVGANVRVMWGAPFLHTLLGKSTGGITTLTFNFNFGH